MIKYLVKVFRCLYFKTVCDPCHIFGMHHPLSTGFSCMQLCPWIRKQNHMDSLCRKDSSLGRKPFLVEGSLGRKPFLVEGSLGRKPFFVDGFVRKQEIRDSLSGIQI